jgi:integrase
MAATGSESCLMAAARVPSRTVDRPRSGIRKRGTSYEASVYLKREERKLRRTFPTLAAAKAWRAEALTAANKGALRGPKPTTIREAWESWHEGAKAGTVRNRSGDPYKPSALRSYEAAMRLRVLPELGGAKLVDVGRPDLQRLVYRLGADGLAPATVQGTILPLRAIFRHAVSIGDLVASPATGLQLPAVRSHRDRIPTPAEAAALIAALRDEHDRALWGTLLCAGLRLGEAQALRWELVDLARGTIRVERGWDAKVGEIEPKSRAAKRIIPIVPTLRDLLLSHKLSAGRDHGFVFGSPERPFTPRSVTDRADTAWRKAGLERITPHEARHVCASILIASGLNAKAVSVLMGHSSIAITFDTYGHLFEGSEAEAAELVGAYLEAQRERAAEQARTAEPAGVGG